MEISDNMVAAAIGGYGAAISYITYKLEDDPSAQNLALMCSGLIGMIGAAGFYYAGSEPGAYITACYASSQGLIGIVRSTRRFIKEDI